MAVQAVHQLAQVLLDACDAVLATTVGGAPAAVFLAPAIPALDRDCDTLVVFETSPVVESVGPVATGALRYSVRTFVGLNATIARCVPVGADSARGYAVPTPAQMTAGAQKVMEDQWALWNGVVTETLDGSLFDGYPCREVRFVSMIPVNDQGGFAGWTLALAVELDGYEVTV